ncbi:hypothetical protein U1Q18_020373, partial [Sarracenia purpurea var. burkii]
IRVLVLLINQWRHQVSVEKSAHSTRDELFGVKLCFRTVRRLGVIGAVTDLEEAQSKRRREKSCMCFRLWFDRRGAALSFADQHSRSSSHSH